MNAAPISGVGPNPPVVAKVEAGSAGEQSHYPASGAFPFALGEYTTAALAAGARLIVDRNRSGSYSANVVWPNSAAICATMPTPCEALDQVERAIRRENFED